MNFNPSPFESTSSLPACWTLATYNVRDLFDVASPNARTSEERPTENELRNKMTRLSRVLHCLDADVVGLMEVETLGVLQRLNREYLADLGYREAILVEGNDLERGIDVALLSRFPVVRTISHANETMQDAAGLVHRLFSRDCLECHLCLPDGEELVVLVNHLKSKRGGEDETRPLRRAQSDQIRRRVETLTAANPLVAVIGDLNDTADSTALEPLFQPGLLTDLGADIPVPLRFSFIHAGEPERIDFLLASRALAKRYVRHSAFAPHDAFAVRASDHAPLRATFGPPIGAHPGYAASLTEIYARDHPVVQRGRTHLRINAARFLPHHLNPWQGQLVIVTGTVRRVEVTRGVGVLRLFLGHADPHRAFRVTIFAEDREFFRAAGIEDIAGYYEGKMAQGVGTLRFFQGVPEIAVQTPRQFRLIVSKESPHGRHGIQL